MYQLAMARAKGGMSMERLTKKVDGVWTALCKYGNSPYPVVTQEIIDRLAAYEDTGFTPEEVQQMRWIPVEERLPEENVTVLAFNADPHAEKYVLARYRTVVYLGRYWCQFDQEYDSWCASCWKVTHWMPLPPSPPAKGEK